MNNQNCDLFAGAEHAGDDLSTFNYLASGIVDVAFVNLKIIENKTEAGESRRLTVFSVLYSAYYLISSDVAGDFYYEKIDNKSINRLPKYRVLGPTLAEAIKGVPYLLAWTSLGSVSFFPP